MKTSDVPVLVTMGLLVQLVGECESFVFPSQPLLPGPTHSTRASTSPWSLGSRKAHAPRETLAMSSGMGFGKKDEKGRNEHPPGDKGKGEGSGMRQMMLQFTCNKCEGRNTFKINKHAYEEGVVICQCQNCNVRHLIADNLGIMKMSEGFGRNIEEWAAQAGTPEQVARMAAPELSPELAEKYNLVLDEDGSMNLVPKE